jgi:hypothetical protein
MKAWVRRQVDQLCQHAQADFGGVDIGGQPTDEFFGATGDPGVSTTAAASDHLHGMPDIEDILADKAFFYDEAELSSPQNVFSIAQNGTTGTVVALGGRDDVGAYGGFGTFDIQTANGRTGSCGVMIQNQTTPNATPQIHLWQRVEELVVRCAPATTLANANQITAVVGGMRSTVNFGATGAAPSGAVSNITDGVYFQITTDGTGAGTWSCVAMNNGTSTTVSTTVTLVNDGTNVGFQNFKINYTHSGTVATFTIDDVQVGTITTNIPPSTRKLAGFGYWVQNVDTGAVRQLVSSFDRLLYVGGRIAPT